MKNIKLTEKQKKWLKAAGVRAVKTVAQTFMSTVGTTTVVMSDVNWLTVLSASALSGILSIATSVAFGLPEVNKIAVKESEEK